MPIKFQFKSINPLLLIPSLFLAYDFLPEWFIYSSAIQLIILTFFRVNKYLGYINFYFLYQIFQTVGKQIIPETMIPSLATLLLAQMFYNKAIKRDESFLFFLWLGIFSVFSSSFSYLVYSISVLIYFFLQQSTDNSLSLRAIINTFIEQRLQLFFTALVAIVLFVFFPRFPSFLPSANYQTQGEIGYSQKVDNSNTANLQLSSKVAFFAELDRNLNPELLYWRGRIHSRTDGYNWFSHSVKPNKNNLYPVDNFITAQMKYEQDFGGDVILLDYPYEIKQTNFPTYSTPGTGEFKFYRTKKKATVTATSFNKNAIAEWELSYPNDYLSLPDFIPNAVKEIADTIKTSTPQEVIEGFKNYLISNQYGYTLNPGPLPTVKDFIQKKRGYCTHFASLLGVILRLKNIPTRLVSGFQGGELNEVGNFYIIKSNDAHTWVEYYDKTWKRIDPTSFVSPARIKLGGTRFLTAPEEISADNRTQNPFMQMYNRFKQQLDNINYKVSLYFDNFNRDKQDELSAKFKMNRKLFYALGVVTGSLMIGLYLLISRSRNKLIIHPVDKLIILLDKKIKLSQKLYHQFTLASKHEIIQNSDLSETTKLAIKNILNDYEQLRYANVGHLMSLKQKIQKLKIRRG